MYARLLIANRGECALRLIRACHELGIAAVCSYARDDAQARYLALAEQCICTGQSRDAYESAPNLLQAMNDTMSQGVLCGYGFLAEDAAFAMQCRISAKDFIGPANRWLALFGDKLASSVFFEQHGLRCIERSVELRSISDARLWAENLGYPVVLKERHGGGGKGVHLCKSREDLLSNWALCQRHCTPGELYLERYIANARHVEFQYIGDRYGNGEIVGARDCSIQVRAQKWIEFSMDLRESELVYSTASSLRQILNSVCYNGLASIEFLQDATGALYFMELNPRLQLEHGVTELTANIDLVQTMIRLSLNERVSYKLEEEQGGVAVQARLYAQSAGQLNEFLLPTAASSPEHILRVDCAYAAGDYVSASYDGLLAKIIVWAKDKRSAFDELRKSLNKVQVCGVKHNKSALLDLVHE